ncbi:MAG TPA: hypothetical protein PLZ51_18445 [Aggregatilineales bacterium]|nr:hypothetical protein [Aggregatilineales bacterium]
MKPSGRQFKSIEEMAEYISSGKPLDAQQKDAITETLKPELEGKVPLDILSDPLLTQNWWKRNRDAFTVGVFAGLAVEAIPKLLRGVLLGHWDI